MTKKYCFILLIAWLLSSCQSTLGPNALNKSHPSYNQAIATSINEQMLLNLVRLRYRDEANFLTVSSVTSSLTLGGSLGMGNIDKAYLPNFGLSYLESPTISYQPLQGEDFLKSVLSPISLDAILVLTQSGWNVERVFGMCVERINNLYNAPSASGPTPDFEPDFQDFKRTLKLFRELQLKRGIEIGVDGDNKLKFSFKKNKANENIIKELSQLLNLENNSQTNLINVGTNFLYPSYNEITLRTRSISSVLFYLSQTVAVPEPHIEQGLITVTKTKDNKTFD